MPIYREKRNQVGNPDRCICQHATHVRDLNMSRSREKSGIEPRKERRRAILDNRTSVSSAHTTTSDFVLNLPVFIAAVMSPRGKSKVTFIDHSLPSWERQCDGKARRAPCRFFHCLLHCFSFYQRVVVRGCETVMPIKHWNPAALRRGSTAVCRQSMLTIVINCPIMQGIRPSMAHMITKICDRRQGSASGRSSRSVSLRSGGVTPLAPRQ